MTTAGTSHPNCPQLETNCGKWLESDKAVARINLQTMRHDLTKWEQVSNTFNLQLRGYGQLVAGRLGKVTRQQLESDQLDKDCVTALLGQTVERLKALNETIDKWEITVVFDNFSDIVKDTVPTDSVWSKVSTHLRTIWTTIRDFVWPQGTFVSQSPGESNSTSQESSREPPPLALHNSFEHQIALLSTTLSAIKEPKSEAKAKIAEFLQCCKLLKSQEGKQSEQTDLIAEGLKAFLESLDTLASVCVDSDQ